mgnify:CR=1 FL=1
MRTIQIKKNAHMGIVMTSAKLKPLLLKYPIFLPPRDCTWTVPHRHGILQAHPLMSSKSLKIENIKCCYIRCMYQYTDTNSDNWTISEDWYQTRVAFNDVRRDISV